MASTAFNYSLTMLDYGQAALAEVFVSKVRCAPCARSEPCPLSASVNRRVRDAQALSLLSCASPGLRRQRDRMHETHLAVLQAKAREAAGAAQTGLGGLHGSVGVGQGGVFGGGGASKDGPLSAAHLRLH